MANVGGLLQPEIRHRIILPLIILSWVFYSCAVKRLGILVAIALLVLLGFVLLRLPSKTDAKAPRFEAVQTQPTGSYTSVHYDWGGTVPFQNGKVWLMTVASATNRHIYLYDMEKRLIVGELFNGGAVFCNRDQTKVLCEAGGGPQRSLFGPIRAWIDKISNGKIPYKPNYVEVFWVLNLEDSSAKRIGELSQIAGTGSRWVPSPGFRYGWNVPNNGKGDVFLCDLEAGTMIRIKPKGDPRGWWNDHTILVEQSASTFVLFDIESRKTTPLFTSAVFGRFLREAGLTNDMNLSLVSNWNGRDYDFYFAQRIRYHTRTESFLLKAERPGPQLKLLYPNFKFEHLGRLNPAATHYLYNGESGASGRGGNGGVYLRDLSNNTVQTIVEPDHRGQYALPRFYGNEVIYFRNRLPWRIDLNGTNNAPLFPN